MATQSVVQTPNAVITSMVTELENRHSPEKARQIMQNTIQYGRPRYRMSSNGGNSGYCYTWNNNGEDVVVEIN
jgi:hypothetical protein